MKKIFIALIALLLMCTSIALAQETEDVGDAGTTPDSALYGLDKAFEKISLAMTFGKAAKAEKRLQIANERIAELKAMTEKGKPEYADDLMKERDKNIDEAIKDVESEEAKGKDMAQVRAHVMEMQQKHILVLQRVLEKVPEQAKQAIQRNIERAQQKQQATAQVMEKKKGPQEKEELNETGKPAQTGQQGQSGNGQAGNQTGNSAQKGKK